MVPAYEGKDPYIFVSYAHKDADFVLPIIEKLYEKKYRVWYDEGIAPGSEWPKNIAEHLNGAQAVIYFVSKNSIASPNCENEVRSGCVPEKDIIQFSMENERHIKLDNARSVDNENSLFEVIDEKFIGDGSGYERKIFGKKYAGLWNVFLGFAALLVMVFGVLLYGLNNGWFDSYLPGINAAAKIQQEITVKTVKKEEAVDFSDGALENAIAAQVGKEDLYELVEFLDEREKAEFINAVGWTLPEDVLTYKALTEMDNDRIWFEYANDHMLSLMRYMPNVREISIRNGDVKDLSVLQECAVLEIVRIDYSVFPVNIPENAMFKVMVLE